MKLFQKLIATPAIISLISGFAVNASEINLNDVASYSDSDLATISNFSEIYPTDWAFQAITDVASSRGFTEVIPTGAISRFEAASIINATLKDVVQLTEQEQRLISEFSTELALLQSRVDGLETRMNDFEAGSFSTTTTMSGSAGFLIGAIDSATDANDAVQFEYIVEVDLNTSFTGEDKLNIEIETGNGLTNVGADKTGLDWGSDSSEALVIDDINYTFPLGSWKVAVGDSMDASKTWPNACSMNNMVDNLGDCGASNSVDLSGDVSFSASTAFGDGWELGFGASGDDGSSTDGMFTKESTDFYGIAIGYETDTYGFTAAYSDKDTASYYGLVAYYSPEELPTTFSGGLEFGDPESGEDTSQWALGVSTDLGEGTLSANYGTNGKIADNAEEIYAYDISYEYPINDSMTITPFVYISETTGTTVDTTGAGAFVTFSF